MKRISRSDGARAVRGMSRWVQLASLPALLLAMAQGGRTAAASPTDRPPAESTARHSMPVSHVPRSGATSPERIASTDKAAAASATAAPAVPRSAAYPSQAAPAGWLQQAQSDAANREYELSWQQNPTVNGVEASWHAPNRSQGFRTYFTPEGIRLVPRTETAPSWRFGLSLVGYGRGGASWVLPRATLAPSEHRMEYQRGALLERYENTPEGLEQVFILPTPPGISGPGAGLARLNELTSPLRQRPVTTQEAAQGREAEREPWVHVDMVLWGDLSPKISEDGQAIDFVTPSGAPALHYAHLKVTDARGEILPAWMEGYSGENLRGIRLVLDVRGATYPITIDPLTTGPAWTAEGEQVNAFFGISVATAGDVNGDGYSDVIVGSDGRAFVYLGSASGLAMTPAWTAASGQAGDQFGGSVAAAGDVNGDGYADVIVGASGYDNGQTDEGRAFVYLGSASGLIDTPSWTAENDQNFSQFGLSVGTAGDVNGDGYSDVIVGAAPYDNGQLDFGRAYVYLGSASGLVTTPAWIVMSDQMFDDFGASVATAGDVNGDTYSDVIVGASKYDNGDLDEGKAFVYLGSASGLASTPIWTAEGNQSGVQFGGTVATAGDVNGDGFADVIVGARFYDNGQSDEGRAFVYYGSAAGPSSSSSWTAEANQDLALFGGSVGTAGDINGDGYADVIVGAFLFDNGQTDEGRTFVYLGSASGLSPTSSWTAESDLAGVVFGFAAATAGDVNGDGYSEVIVGAHLYANGQANEGRAYLYLGSAEGLATSSAWARESDQGHSFFGQSVATAGDVNGDGYSDVVVGAPNYDNGETDEGRAYLYLGSAAGLSLTPVWTAEGNQPGASFGTAAATAGDVNGDGYSDVVVGASAYDNVETDEGRAYLYLGSAAGLSSTPAWTAEPNQNGAGFGISVATAGDVNGDGYSDVIVGAQIYDNPETNEGRAFLYLGSPTGLSSTPAWTAESNQASAFFGRTVATAGDVNGDGYSDVLVGAPGYTNGQTIEGRAYLYLGSQGGLSSTPAWTAESNQADAEFGFFLSTAGDVDGDGYSEVIVGAGQFDDDQINEGRAFVYHGENSPAGLSLTPVWTADGNQDNAGFGQSGATAGDVNGDGYSDVIVGAALFDLNGVVDEGRALVYLGSAAGLSSIPAWTVDSNIADAQFGLPVAMAGDVNGDGYSDVIVGAIGYTNGQINEGAAFVYYGGGGDGLDRVPRQARADGAAPIALLGKSDSGIAIRLRERGITPAGRGKIRLQYEVKPLGTSFNGTGLGSSAAQDTGTPAGSGSAVSLDETVTGLTKQVYRWRSRIVSSDPFFPRSPWMSLAGNNVTESKLRASGCLDIDGDGYGEIGGVFCLSLVPDCNDQNAAAWGTPGEVVNLRFTTTTTMLWDLPANPGAPASALLFDVLRSAVPGNFLLASCLESNDGPNTTATDATALSVGQRYFYLTRAENACLQGTGSLGNMSSGTPRVGVDCP